MSTRRADIEGLRAIAILLVILYHAGVAFMPGGFVGVDVFFALSGYLITGLLLAELDKTGHVDMVGFYARRARRLLPASALVVVATLAAVWALLGPLDQVGYTGTALASATYLSNVWFGLNATDYVAAPPETNPFLHMWSLAVEEQFYLAWPLLVLIVWRVARARATFVFGALCVVSLAVTIALQSSDYSQWAFFASPPRAWEFGVGALGALAVARVPAWASWVGLSAILVPALAYGPLTRFPGLAAVPPVVGTVLVLQAGNASVLRVLASRPMQVIGGLSYSWYLWHWPVLVLARSYVPHLGPWGGLACSVFALGLSAVTFRAVEAPIRHARWLVPRPWTTLAAAGALTVAVLAVCMVWRKGVRTGSRAPGQAPFVAARHEMPKIYGDGCHLGVDEAHIRDCVFGSPASATTIVLWGDSHAAQWFPALNEASIRHGWRLVPMTKSGCPPADIEVSPSCDTWRRSAIAAIKNLSPALVLLANANVYVEGTDARLVRVSPEAFKEASKRTLETLAGTRTVVMLPIPRPGFDVPMCLARLQWRPRLAPSCDVVPAPSRTRELEKAAAEGMPGVTLLDLAGSICARTPCPSVVNDRIVYRDDNHLTARFSATLAPIVAERLTPLLAGQPGGTYTRLTATDVSRARP